jgi:hypothetical protein
MTAIGITGGRLFFGIRGQFHGNRREHSRLLILSIALQARRQDCSENTTPGCSGGEGSPDISGTKGGKLATNQQNVVAGGVGPI